MKLRNLKGAIRKTASVKFAVNGPMGRIDITCVKSDLMADLDRLYASDGQAETGLWVNEDGFLTREADYASPAENEATSAIGHNHTPSSPTAAAIAAAAAAGLTDIDALLGGADDEEDFEDLLS